MADAGGRAVHANNFGALRLVFATLVILSHSFPITQGWANSEPLARLTGTVAFGELAVDFFFLLSGYLITQSAEKSRGNIAYLKKRIARIYPGFIVASLVSIFVVGMLAGGRMNNDPLVEAARVCFGLVTLSQPQLTGAFQGAHYTALNGSLWTIRYEFICYIIVMVAHAAGLLRHRPAYLAIIAALFVTTALVLLPGMHPVAKAYNGVRLTAFFLTGGAFYLYRSNIRYDDRLAVVAALVLLASMSNAYTANVGIAVAGGYLLFWLGFRSLGSTIQGVGQKNDISYGVYLYAWPIQNLVAWYAPGVSPWVVFLVSTPAAYLFGAISWVLVERPALAAVHKK